MKNILRTSSKKSIVETITALIVFLFMYTALSKFIDHAIFVEVLGKSPLLGYFKNVVSIAIPIIEIILVVLLTMPPTRLKGLWGSLALLSAFTLYLIYMVVFTPKLPCSCGGVLSQMTWVQHIFFNLAFIGMAFLAIRLSKKMKKEIENANSSLIAYA
jgi:uncharacterized membrane protein